MEPKLKILHLEDQQSDSDLIDIQLNKANMQFENVVVDTKAEFMSALQRFTPDIILADHSLTSFNSLEALKIVKENNMDIPFLLVTTSVSEEFAGKLVKEGAKGYVLKDNLDSLPEAIRKALDNVFLKGEDYPVTEVILTEEKLYDLRMLEEMDDVDYLVEIVSVFLAETPVELREMKLAAMANKTAIVTQKAHKLKSSSGLLEASKLTGILEQIEETVKAGNQPDELKRLVEAANAEYKKIEISLNDHLKIIRR